MPLLSVGSIVHYVSQATGEPVCRAAIITEVGEYPPGVSDADRAVSVTVFLPDVSFTDRCTQSEDDHRGGTWHWPERTDA